jgi:nucleotide-binding universal stress UspA family protein
VYQRILVPIDGSATADRGLHEAINLAGRLKAKLRVLHVLDNFPLQAEWASAKNFEEILDRLRRESDTLLAKARSAAQEASVSVQTQRLEAGQMTTSDVILDEAANAHCDLIVMGTHGRRGMNRLAMGSTAEAVARRSTVPLLMARHPA